MFHPFRNHLGLELIIILSSLIPFYRIITTITIPSLIQTTTDNISLNKKLSSVSYKIQTQVVNNKLKFNVINMNELNILAKQHSISSNRVHSLDEIIIEIIKLLLDNIIDIITLVITFISNYGSIVFNILYKYFLYLMIFIYHVVSNNPSLVNIQIHSMNTIILYKLAIIILSHSNKRYYSQFISRHCCLLGIIYFAVHPSRIPFITNSYVSSNIYTFCVIIGTYLLFLHGKLNNANNNNENKISSYAILGSLSYLAAIIVILINTASPILLISSIIPIVAVILIYKFIFDDKNKNISSSYLISGMVMTGITIIIMSSKLISTNEATIRKELLNCSQIKDFMYSLYNSSDINNYLLIISGIIDAYGEQFWPSFAFNNSNYLVNRLNTTVTMIMNSYLVKNGIINWKHLILFLSTYLTVLLNYSARYVDEHDILQYFNVLDNSLNINDNPFEYIVRITMLISLFFFGLYIIRSLLFISKLLFSFTSPRNNSYIFILWVYSLLCIPTAISNFIRVNPSYGHEIECNKLMSAVLFSPNKKVNNNNNNNSLVFSILPSNSVDNSSWKWGWTNNSKNNSMSQICPQQLYFNCYIPASFFCILLCVLFTDCFASSMISVKKDDYTVSVFRYEEFDDDDCSNNKDKRDKESELSWGRQKNRLIHCPPNSTVYVFNFIYRFLLLNIVILGLQTYLLSDPQ